MERKSGILALMLSFGIIASTFITVSGTLICRSSNLNGDGETVAEVVCKSSQYCCGPDSMQCCNLFSDEQNFFLALHVLMVPLILLIVACCLIGCITWCCCCFFRRNRNSGGVIYSQASTTETGGVHQVIYNPRAQYPPQAPYPPQPQGAYRMAPPVYGDTTQLIEPQQPSVPTSPYKPLADQLKAQNV